jgi:hypothetical protein
MMKRFSDTNDSDFERLLRQRAAENDASPHEDVTRFFSAIEDVYPEESTSALEERHVAAMMGTARAMDASVEANKLIAEAASASRARSRLLTQFASHRWSSVASIALLLVFLAFGGAAYAGVLPDPIQQATSDLAARIGIHVPTPLAGGNGRAIGLRRISDEKYDGGWNPGGSQHSGEATPGVGAGIGGALGPGAPASAISTPSAGGAHEATGSPNANAAAKGAAASAGAGAKKVTKKATSKAAKKAKKSKKAPKKSSAGSSSSSGSGNSANQGNSGNSNGNSSGNSNGNGNGSSNGNSNGNGNGSSDKK